MSPTINYGDLAITYKTPFQNLKVGEIIVFQDPRGNPSTYVHRIVAIVTCQGGARCLETKGDNSATNPTKDPWNVTQNYYESQVILIVPYAGYLSPSLWGLSGPAAALPIVFVVLLVAFLSWLAEQKKSTNKNKEKVVEEQTPLISNESSQTLDLGVE